MFLGTAVSLTILPCTIAATCPSKVALEFRFRHALYSKVYISTALRPYLLTLAQTLQAPATSSMMDEAASDTELTYIHPRIQPDSRTLPTDHYIDVDTIEDLGRALNRLSRKSKVREAVNSLWIAFESCGPKVEEQMAWSNLMMPILPNCRILRIDPVETTPLVEILRWAERCPTRSIR